MVKELQSELDLFARKNNLEGLKVKVMVVSHDTLTDYDTNTSISNYFKELTNVEEYENSLKN